MSVPIITIDGPSGVGKGTLAQYLTQRMGFHLLDSGAIYRALAYGVQQAGLDPQTDIKRIIQLAQSLPVQFSGGKVWYQMAHGQQDISQMIRNETIAGIASQVAAIPEVREALLHRQKAFAEAPGLIADGRDMGTVVFPNAILKLFLTASPEVRAQRRVKQLAEQGIQADLEEITREIAERDARDQNRKTAPLKPAEDAIVIDTSHLNREQVFEQVYQLLKKKALI